MPRTTDTVAVRKTSKTPTTPKTSKTSAATKSSKSPTVQKTPDLDTPVVYTPPRYDPAEGKKALGELRPALKAISKDRLASVRVNVESATVVALGVAGFVTSPEVLARFMSLPDKELDKTAVTGLTSACFATLYALGEARAAGGLESEAKVSPEIAAEAAEVEARMQRLCEYHFSDDPELGPEVERLRPGTGLRDLASDLLGYARIYELRSDVVKRDEKHHREGDAERATKLGGTILQAFSAASTPKAREAFELYARAWTLLVDRYSEVRSAGLWLFRREDLCDERFPSLFAASRAAPARKTEAAGEGEAPSPAGEGAATGATGANEKGTVIS